MYYKDILYLLSKNDKKKIIINKNKIIINNEYYRYNSLKKYIEYLLEIIK